MAPATGYDIAKTDGFFGSELYKVLLPPDAGKAETTLRRIGLGGQVDKAIPPSTAARRTRLVQPGPSSPAPSKR
jgi:hypothetical protein